MVVHAVHGRLEAVVGQPGHEVANVDHESVLTRGHLDPLPVLGQHLQTPDIILPEEREALQVRVRAEADVDDALYRPFVLGVVVEDAVAMGALVSCLEANKPGKVQGTHLPGYVTRLSK